MDEIKVLREVLENENRAISKLIDSLGQSHLKMISMCHECSGKIVITGMGKSGHVARKISATMSSLGTPSFFLHPGEAAHGDLGMVERRDVVIMISKSGETDELLQLISSLKIIGCKLIGVFCKEGSTLEKHCDHTVILPIEREACVNNLAPTTSTTVTMAFGDAVAIVLSQMKNFGKQDFALFHPLGTLGKQLLLNVDHLANKKMDEIAVRENAEVRKILWVITQNRLGAVTVIDSEGKLVGLITDGDIRRAIEKNEGIMSMKAEEIMTNNPIKAINEMLVVDAFKLMQSKKISVLPTVDENEKLIGVVSIYSIIETGVTGE